MGILIEENNVEIRRIAQFLPTQFAIADDGESRFMPVLAPQSRPRKVEYTLKYQIRKVGQVVAQFFKWQQPFHILCQQLKYLGMVKMPQHIHLLFDILAIRAAS